jgi:hypothetical protein
VNLVALDPGLRLCGVALFTDGVLTAAALVRNPVKTVRGPAAWFGMGTAVKEWLAPKTDRVDMFVCELMQVYKHTRNPADLIELAGVDGACAVSVNALDFGCYQPRQWKPPHLRELRDKTKHNEWTWSKMTDLEKAAVEPCAPSLKHNVMDAIGIGFFYLKR